MIERPIQRAQVYYFLARAFLYPQHNWLEDLPEVSRVLEEMGSNAAWDAGGEHARLDLADLQSQHRDLLGLTGSLCYETELGLPHEFRQSQELADIAGFYKAFGFQTGGAVRERPDHIVAELEFMYLLALKEAHAMQNGMPEGVSVSIDAQRKFLSDHLGQWIQPFCASLAQSTQARLGQDPEQSPYMKLARLAEAFISEDARRLGAHLEGSRQTGLQPTPFDADYSCAGCAAADPIQ